MDIEVAREFLSRMVHLKEADAAVTLCGISALGLLVRRLWSILQLNSKKGCKGCIDEYTKRVSEDKR